MQWSGRADELKAYRHLITIESVRPEGENGSWTVLYEKRCDHEWSLQYSLVKAVWQKSMRPTSVIKLKQHLITRN